MLCFRSYHASEIGLWWTAGRGEREVSEIVFGQLVFWSTGQLKFAAKVRKIFDICKFFGLENVWFLGENRVTC